MAQSPTQVESQNKDLVVAAFAAWAAGTGGPFDLLAPDATWTIAGRSLVAKKYPNRAAFMGEVIQPFNARMRQRLIPVVKEIAADGDRVIVRFDASAVAHDGQPYVNSYAWFLTLRNEKVVDVVAFFDSIAFDELWTRVSPASSDR